MSPLRRAALGLVFSACGLALVGCASSGGAERASVTVEVEVEEPARYTLVHPSTLLHTHADDASPALSGYASAATAERVLHASVFRWVGERDGWVELETPGELESGRHCASGMSGLDGLRLRLFARPSQKVFSAPRELALKWRDGTAVTLSPGTPLYPSEDGHFYRAVAGYFVVPVKLEPDERTPSYRPGKVFVRDDSQPGELSLSSKAVLAGRAEFGGSGALGSLYQLLPLTFVDRAEPRGDKLLTTFTTRCAQFTVLVPKEDVEKVGVVGGLMGSSREQGKVWVRPGATVYWPDGTPAGEAIRAVPFDEEEASQEGRRCMKKALRYIKPGEQDVRPENWLHLCAAEADVSAEKPKS